MIKEALQRQNVKSSNIRSVGYMPIRHKLEVEFKNGTVYRYKAVPKSVYKGLMDASSKGKFLNSEIKPTYEYRKYRNKDGEMVEGGWVIPKSASELIDMLYKKADGI